MRQLFLDMDGVLADFDKAARSVLGMDSYKFEFVHGTKEFWKQLDAVPDFFLGFDMMPDAQWLWANTKGLQPIILTAIPKNDVMNVAGQKRAWVDRHLGSHVKVITCLTEDKPLYCKPGDILVDDRTVNRDEWERAGGKFIHHLTAHQSTIALIRCGVFD